MLVTVHLAPGIRQSLCEDQSPLVERVVVVQTVHVLVVLYLVFEKKGIATCFQYWNKCWKKTL